MAALMDGTPEHTWHGRRNALEMHCVANDALRPAQMLEVPRSTISTYKSQVPANAMHLTISTIQFSARIGRVTLGVKHGGPLGLRQWGEEGGEGLGEWGETRMGERESQVGLSQWLVALNYVTFLLP